MRLIMYTCLSWKKCLKCAQCLGIRRREVVLISCRYDKKVGGYMKIGGDSIAKGHGGTIFCAYYFFELLEISSTF